MGFCKKQLTTYQQRSLRTIDTMMGICIAVNIILEALLERHHLTLSIPVRYGMAFLSIAPIIPTILLIARYLRGEKTSTCATSSSSRCCGD